ncbi:hypothetical protein [Streptomyces sp. NPDC001948]
MAISTERGQRPPTGRPADRRPRGRIDEFHERRETRETRDIVVGDHVRRALAPAPTARSIEVAIAMIIPPRHTKRPDSWHLAGPWNHSHLLIVT